MATSKAAVTVLEQIPVAPPPEGTPKLTLPLTFLDLLCLHMIPVHRLIFYQHPISRTHFLDTLIPTMKNSLSLTLQHYTPLSGRLIASPNNSTLPEIRYEEGDTVPLVFAEVNSGECRHFDDLTSGHARSCTEFHPLVPSLPPASRAPDGSVAVPVLALQVTLFPDVGICIGITNHHAVGDASSIFGFMKAWAFFYSHKDDETTLPAEFRPFYDRTVLKDEKGLETFFWDNVKNIKIEDKHVVHRLPLITNKIRATFTLTRHDFQRLKNRIISRRPKLARISSFTAACSYVWTCLVKSRDTDNDTGDGDEVFACAADCRLRLDPPVPGNYFGNCLVGCFGCTKTKKLAGEEGLLDAADVIGESIRRQLYDKEYGVLRGAEDSFKLLSTINSDRSLIVSGSPKFDYYELDFGWGSAKKFEMPSTDLTRGISVSKAKDHQAGGLEIGLSLPTTRGGARNIMSWGSNLWRKFTSQSISILIILDIIILSIIIFNNTLCNHVYTT